MTLRQPHHKIVDLDEPSFRLFDYQDSLSAAAFAVKAVYFFAPVFAFLLFFVSKISMRRPVKPGVWTPRVDLR